MDILFKRAGERVNCQKKKNIFGIRPRQDE